MKFLALTVFLTGALLGGCGGGDKGDPGPKGDTGAAGPAYTVAESAGCSGIQAAIDTLPAQGGQVIVAAGTYSCSNPIVIDRDNVALRGQGASTVLRLANGANAPILVLGQTIAVPTVTRHNLQVSDFMIDGNRLNQTYECLRGPCTPTNPLRNNGITPRRVSDVLIERIIVHSARSGGLVCELGCRRVTVRDFTSTDNYFDGMAGYQTEDSIFSNVNLYNNCSAGFSFDIDFDRNIISNVIIARDSAIACGLLPAGTVGIFIRDSHDNIFNNIQIENAAEDGIFVAQVNTDATTGATGNVFSNLVVLGSGHAGIRVNDNSCVNNEIVGAQFAGNVGGCVSESTTGLVQVSGVVCQP